MWGDISLLFCIYLVVNDVCCCCKHLVIYPLSARISFLEKYLLSSSDHFKIGLFFLLLLVVWIPYTHTHTHTHTHMDIYFPNIFFHSICCLFTLMIVSFTMQDLFSLMHTHWFIFDFWFDAVPFIYFAFAMLLLSYPKNYCQD